MSKVRDEYRTTYIPSEDVTIVWQELYLDDEPLQTSLVGFYYGEPDEQSTKDFSNMPLTAQFLV